MRLNWFISISFKFGMAFALVGCSDAYWPLNDPICCNQTPLQPSQFWIPQERCPIPLCEDCEEIENENLENESPLELADLIDIALQNNPTTRQTWAGARAAAYGIKVAASPLFPSINVQSAVTYQDFRLDEKPDLGLAALAGQAQQASSPTINVARQQGCLSGGAAGDFGDFGCGSTRFQTNCLNINYLLLDFGGRSANIEAARQALYISDWMHNRQIQQVLLSVLDAYYTYEGIANLLTARHYDLKNAEENVKSARELFEAGVVTKLDLLQAETNLVNTQLNIVELQGQAEVTRGRLITLLGLPGNTPMQIASFPDTMPLEQINGSVDNLIKMAKEQRPDLAASYANLQQARAEVVVARSAGLPTLEANLNLQNNIYFHNSSFNNRSLCASVALNIPLFNGFFFYNQTKQAQERVRSACAEIKETELQVILDVITSYSHFKTAVETLKYTEKYLKFSQETYDAAFISYNEGIGTILDLLSAQQTLADARAQRVEARTKWAISLAGIAFSTGILGINYPDLAHSFQISEDRS